jgi:hypothetical protein
MVQDDVNRGSNDIWEQCVWVTQSEEVIFSVLDPGVATKIPPWRQGKECKTAKEVKPDQNEVTVRAEGRCAHQVAVVLHSF